MAVGHAFNGGVGGIGSQDVSIEKFGIANGQSSTRIQWIMRIWRASVSCYTLTDSSACAPRNGVTPLRVPLLTFPDALTGRSAFPTYQWLIGAVNLMTQT